MIILQEVYDKSNKIKSIDLLKIILTYYYYFEGERIKTKNVNDLLIKLVLEMIFRMNKNSNIFSLVDISSILN